MVTNDADVAEIVFGAQLRAEPRPRRRVRVRSLPPARRNQGLDSLRMGSMFRGNEMMAAFTRAQLARLPERTERCQRNADRLSAALAELPGVTPPSAPAGRTSVHHKFRVHLDPQRADLPPSARALRDVMLRALRAEGSRSSLRQSVPLPAQGVFQQRDERGGHPRQLPGGTDLARNYDPARYPRTRALLDGSILLFSQSYPLIAQSDLVRRPLRRCLPQGVATARAARRRGRGAVVSRESVRAAARVALACAGLALVGYFVHGAGPARVGEVLLDAGPWLLIIVAFEPRAAHDRRRRPPLPAGQGRGGKVPVSTWGRSSAIAYAMMSLVPAGRVAGEVTCARR